MKIGKIFKKIATLILCALIVFATLFVGNIFFVGSDVWINICHAIFILLTLLMSYLFLYTEGFFSRKKTKERFYWLNNNSFLAEILIWFLPVLYAAAATFLIYKLAALPTLYFANKPFEETAKVSYAYCAKWTSRHDLIYTMVYLFDEKSSQSYEVKFIGNLCEKNPVLMGMVSNNYITLSGREWMLGKTYNGFCLLGSKLAKDCVQGTEGDPLYYMLKQSMKFKL